jgi:hypothetical protein
LRGIPYEYVSLNRDTSAADLRQRRELRDGNTTLEHGPVLRAAVNGHVLILDGLGKVEPNLLPLINELLESRQMELEDGFLLAPEAYDRLDADARANPKLLRCHEQFRVLALVTPTKFDAGLPLDPPLRSRFQSRYV